MDGSRSKQRSSTPESIDSRALILFVARVTGSLPCIGQDTTFYSETLGQVHSKSECDRYVVKGPDPASPEHVLTISRTRNGSVEWEERTILEASGNFVSDGISKRYYADGSVRYEREYAHGAHVRIASFWEGGQPKRLDIFVNDSLVSGKCFKKNGSLDTHYPFEIAPEFTGGVKAMYKYMKKNIRYPDEAYKRGITGKVYINFTIDKEGSVKDPKVIRSADVMLDAEALKVVREMPRWVPGRIDGEPVKCQFNLPVVFKL